MGISQGWKTSEPAFGVKDNTGWEAEVSHYKLKGCW